MENSNLSLENRDISVPKSRKDQELEREIYEMLTEDISGRPNRRDLCLQKELEDKDILEWERELREKVERDLYGIPTEDITEENFDSLNPGESDWIVFGPEDFYGGDRDSEEMLDIPSNL